MLALCLIAAIETKRLKIFIDQLTAVLFSLYLPPQDSDDDDENNIVVGVCAMAKKSQSKPMKEILTRLQVCANFCCVVNVHELYLSFVLLIGI